MKITLSSQALAKQMKNLVPLAIASALFGGAILVGMNASSLTAADLLHPTKRYPILAKCSGYEGKDFVRPRFSDLDEDTDPMDIWSDTYDENVEAVITEYVNPDFDVPDCEAATSDLLLVPPPTMVNMAKRLPPWEHPADYNKITRHDLGPILLEYLRTFECSLVERNLFLPVDVADEMLFQAGSTGSVLWMNVFKEHAAQRRKIVEYIESTRKTMHRLVTLVGGTEKMRLLNAELECVQRASLDARNGFALAAEAASCMPRIWDHKDPLRDYDQRR